MQLRFNASQPQMLKKKSGCGTAIWPFEFQKSKPPKKVCEGCLVSKQPRKAFKSYAPQRAKQPLGVVHS